MRSPLIWVTLLAVITGFCTCKTGSRVWPTPCVEKQLRKKKLCIEKISFFTNDHFTEPAEDSSLVKFAKEESQKALQAKLVETGFIMSCCSSDKDQLHIVVDAGLRIIFMQYFIVARVRVYDSWDADPEKRLVCQIMSEAQVKSDREADVRQTGNVLADKISANLKAALNPSD